jgi:hypothetical protein
MTESFSGMEREVQKIISSHAAPAELSAEQLDIRHACETSFHEFLKHSWCQIEPTEFQDNWHIEMLADHFSALASGQIRRLMICTPPRVGKSTIANVAFPSFLWCQNPQYDPVTKQTDESHAIAVSKYGLRGPGIKTIGISYSMSLSSRDSRQMRRLVESNWYQQLWGDRVQISSDMSAILLFGNTAGGTRQSLSITSQITGTGADLIICDDPINVSKVDSPGVRENVIKVWSDVLQSRQNDINKSGIVLIQQRSHQRDLAGYLLDGDKGWTIANVDGRRVISGWTKVILPMRYEPDHSTPVSTAVISKDGLPWTDPRSEPGELLWPSRFPADKLDELYDGMTSHAIASQYQQNPVPREGAIYKKTWFENIIGFFA